MTSLPRRLCGIAMLSGLIALAGSQADAGNFSSHTAARTSNQHYVPSVNPGAIRQTNVGYGAGGAPPAAYGGSYGRGHRPHHFDPNTQFDGVGTSSANGVSSVKPK